MVLSCILPYITYIHKYIDACIYTYKHTYCTYKHSKIYSFTLVRTHYILYIYSSIFLLQHTYIHLSAASSIASSSARFSSSCFLLLTFSFFLIGLRQGRRAFILKIIFNSQYPIEVRLFTVHDSPLLLLYMQCNIMGATS